MATPFVRTDDDRRRRHERLAASVLLNGSVDF
jgi:hypothetical protein